MATITINYSKGFCIISNAYEEYNKFEYCIRFISYNINIFNFIEYENKIVHKDFTYYIHIYYNLTTAIQSVVECIYGNEQILLLCYNINKNDYIHLNDYKYKNINVFKRLKNYNIIYKIPEKYFKIFNKIKEYEQKILNFTTLCYKNQRV